jgi:hypothetical protein
MAKDIVNAFFGVKSVIPAGRGKVHFVVQSFDGLGVGNLSIRVENLTTGSTEFFTSGSDGRVTSGIDVAQHRVGIATDVTPRYIQPAPQLINVESAVEYTVNIFLEDNNASITVQVNSVDNLGVEGRNVTAVHGAEIRTATTDQYGRAVIPMWRGRQWMVSVGGYMNYGHPADQTITPVGDATMNFTLPIGKAVVTAQYGVMPMQNYRIDAFNDQISLSERTNNSGQANFYLPGDNLYTFRFFSEFGFFAYDVIQHINVGLNSVYIQAQASGVVDVIMSSNSPFLLKNRLITVKDAIGTTQSKTTDVTGKLSFNVPNAGTATVTVEGFVSASGTYTTTPSKTATVVIGATATVNIVTNWTANPVLVTTNKDFVVPVDGLYGVRPFGGGGGGAINTNLMTTGSSLGGGAGGGGHMAYSDIQLTKDTVIPITIGAGGAANSGTGSSISGGSGGITSFGSLISASGGEGGKATGSEFVGAGYQTRGGDGGSGGGAGIGSYAAGLYTDGKRGGDGSYGGGGGGAYAYATSSSYTATAITRGGNGGRYGGGGGGGPTQRLGQADGGKGGEFGGNGGAGGWFSGTTYYAKLAALNGTNTRGKGLEFEGDGLAGKIPSGAATYLRGGGAGGGGYGGNGGNNDNLSSATVSFTYLGGAGGGGYGADGGSIPALATSPGNSGACGGGGFGGKGGDAKIFSSPYAFSRCGGGGGYGKTWLGDESLGDGQGYGAGGSSNAWANTTHNASQLTTIPRPGLPGICVIYMPS